MGGATVRSPFLMTPHVLGYRTDAMLARMDGEVMERDGYLVVATPNSPHFWCGNFLLFDRAPTAADVEPWTAAFEREFGGRRGIEHVHLAWDSMEDVDLEPFQARGFQPLSFVTLKLTAAPPPSVVTTVEVRAIEGDREWAAMLAVQLRSRPPSIEVEVNDVFQRDQFARYRELVERGRGRWYGAFAAGELVAGMGLFGGVQEDAGIVRGQSVSTVPEARRRGIADRLVRAACRDAFESMDAHRVVFLADPDGPALGLYQRIGFQVVERFVSVARASAH